MAELDKEKEDLKAIVKEHVQSIKKNILFQDFPLNGLIKFLISCKQNNHKPGDVIFKENEPSSSMSIVLKGKVSISKGGSKICDLEPPALLGEIGLFTEEPRNATVSTIDDVLSLTITQADLNGFIQREPKLAITLYRNIAFCLRNKINNDNQQIMSLQEENAKMSARLEELELIAGEAFNMKEDPDNVPADMDESLLADIEKMAGDKNKDKSGDKDGVKDEDKNKNQDGEKDEDLSKNRKNVRVAISNRNLCHVKIEEETFDVLDLSIGGFNVNRNDNFWIEGEVLKGDIFFKDEPPFQFEGTVRNESGETCGVQFNRVPLNLESAVIKIVNYLQRLGAII